MFLNSDSVWSVDLSLASKRIGSSSLVIRDEVVNEMTMEECVIKRLGDFDGRVFLTHNSPRVNFFTLCDI